MPISKIHRYPWINLPCTVRKAELILCRHFLVWKVQKNIWWRKMKEEPKKWGLFVIVRIYRNDIKSKKSTNGDYWLFSRSARREHQKRFFKDFRFQLKFVDVAWLRSSFYKICLMTPNLRKKRKTSLDIVITFSLAKIWKWFSSSFVFLKRICKTISQHILNKKKISTVQPWG